jgi:hypothetical protein
MNADFIKNEGFLHTRNGRGFISHLATSLPKKGQIDPAVLYNAFVNTYFNPLRLVPPSNNKPKINKIFTLDDFQSSDETYCYKNIDKKFLPEIEKGNFRLGVILDYRKVEGKLWQDPAEGNTMLSIKGKEKDIFTIVTGGLNYYIFCASLTENKDSLLVNNFGEVKLKIHIKQFAESITRSINARTYFIQKLKYSDAKSFQIDLPGLSLPDNLDGLDDITFEELIKCSSFPSLFVKPTYFENENEVRIAFEMDKNVSTPITINDKEALNSLSVI